MLQGLLLSIPSFSDPLSNLRCPYQTANAQGQVVRESCRSLRHCNDDDKRAAYEQQQGICPICGKYFDFEKMYADHITPMARRR